ncbi:UNVERIFIED_CONTAM: hypothetical protein GTU68_050859 [Idotea baltica]|nr:hypothetical protein [Idotea baltica]
MRITLRSSKATRTKREPVNTTSRSVRGGLMPCASISFRAEWRGIASRP